MNGNEWAQRQAAKAGIGFEALDNGFAAVDDVEAPQRIRDSFRPEHIEALGRTWLAILPNPFTPADEAAGYQYELSIPQAEFSLTQMLDRPVSGRISFEQVLHDNLDIGRPDHTSLVVDRRIITKGVVPSPHVDYNNAKIKQYHKEGRAPQTETTINDTRDFGLSTRRTNLTALRQIGFSANRRLLGVQRISHDPIHGSSIHRPHRTNRRRHQRPHPRSAFRRPPRPHAPAGPAYPPATTPRLYQSRPAHPHRAPPRHHT